MGSQYLLLQKFLFQSNNVSILPHILPHILPQPQFVLPQTTTTIPHPPTMFTVANRNTGESFDRTVKILRGLRLFGKISEKQQQQQEQQV